MSKFSGLALAGLDQPARMTIMHPVTFQPIRNDDGEAWIDVYSASSATARAFERRVNDAALKRRGRTITADDLDAQMTDRAAAYSKGWNLLAVDGSPLDIEFSQQNARELYTECPWIRDQVIVFANDLGNFPSGASQN